MIYGDKPGYRPVIWAESAPPDAVRDIPDDGAVTIPNLSTYDSGFPPITFIPRANGGDPPDGADFNGAFRDFSSAIRWNQAGGWYAYDADFAAKIGGYPEGAILQSSDKTGFWRSTANSNLTVPGDSGASWLPLSHYGSAAVAISSANVTLSPDQYAKPQIALTGTLTAARNLIFPQVIGQWLVNNGTSGYSITAKTASGTGITLLAGTQLIYCDGTDIAFCQPLTGIAALGIGDGLESSGGNLRVKLATSSCLSRSASGMAVQVADTSLSAGSSGLSVALAASSGLEIVSGLKVKASDTSLTVASGGASVNLLSTGGLQVASGVGIKLPASSGLTVGASGLAVQAADSSISVGSSGLSVNRATDQAGSFLSAIASGTVDAITASFTPAITSLTAGMTLRVRASGTNTLVNPTFTPNSGTISAKTIVKGSNSPLSVADIAGTRHWMILVYDATLDKWILQNPAYPVSLASASESAPGITRYATAAEVAAGSSNALSMSPASFFGDASLASSGHYRLPGGLMMQWGQVGAIAVSSGVDVTFPVAFTSAVLSAQATVIATSDTSPDSGAMVRSVTTSGMRVVNADATAAAPGAYWFVIGQ